MKNRAAQAIVLLLLLASCGKSAGLDSAQAPAVSSPPAAELLASFPGLPEDRRVHPLRATAQAEAILSGSQFESSSPGVVTATGTAQLASAAESLEWAIYRFSGSSGETIDQLSSEIAGLAAGERAWLAISDYSDGSWFFLPPQALPLNTAALDDTPGRWQSPAGNTFVAVVAFDGDSFDIGKVRLRYTERFSISGLILDGEGAPVEGVLVSTIFGGLSDISASDGSYTLSGLPNGSWPVAATKNGWTFYDQPLLVEIADSDGNGNLFGSFTGSNFTLREALPNNNNDPGPVWDFAAGPLVDSVSATDDPRDYYSFTISQPGDYYLYFHDPLGTALFPSVELNTASGDSVAYSAVVLAGSFAVGFHIHDDTPENFIVEVGCNAGGADYTLSLEQGMTFAVGGAITGTPGLIRAAVVEMEQLDLAHETEYLTTSTVGNISYVDFHRVPGETLVLPAVEGYSFTPAELSLDLDETTMDADFTLDQTIFSDSFEPNNDSGSAHEFTTLPYEGLDALSIGGPDFADWYRFSPDTGDAPGLAVELDSPVHLANPFVVRLYDDSLTDIGLFVVNEDGFLLVPQVLSTGNDFFISIESSETLPRPYRIVIEPYEAVGVSFGLTAGADPVPGALLEIRSEDFEELYRRTTQDDGISAPLYFEEGAILNIECFRHGLAIDRHTRRITVGASDQEVIFSAPDWGLDSHEPNNDEEQAETFSLPLSVSALMSNKSDDRDYYRILNPGNGVLRISFSAEDGGSGADISARGPLLGGLGSEDIDGSGAFYIEPQGEAFVDIRLNAEAPDFAYSLSVDQAEAYRISGVIKNDNGDAVAGARVVVRETNQRMTTQADGTYETELLPPGDYELLMLTVGYDPSFAGFDIDIVDSDVTQDLSGLAVQSSDQFEPNDSPFEAHEIQPGDVVDASCGDLVSGDSSDYYIVQGLTAGQRIRFLIATTPDISTISAQVEDELGIPLGDLYEKAPGLIYLDAVIPANGGYLLRIAGSGEYTLAVTDES